MPIVYRLQQVWLGVTARPLPSEAWQQIAPCLTEAEQELFGRFSARDQRHSYRVWQMLREAGHNDSRLLAAALLHDVGKTQVRLSLLERSLAVLAEALFPDLTAAWGRPNGRAWQRPFRVRACHAAWGAEMAREAGSDPVTVALIRHHQDDLAAGESSFEPAVAQRLRLLQWADDRN